ncbi:ATP synthase f chain, mitochondrial precursor [Cerrena zonata]
MSFIIRRQLSTLIPPKVASAKNIGSNPNAKRMADVVSFYKKLPTGPAPGFKKPTTPWGKYKAAYFEGDNASGKPLIHLAIAVILFGYTWEYQSHLKHHKDH